MRILSVNTPQAATKSAPSRAESAALTTESNTVNMLEGSKMLAVHGQRQEVFSSLDRLVALSAEVDVETVILPQRDLQKLPTVYGPEFVPEGEVDVRVVRKERPNAELHRTIHELRQQVQKMSNTSDDQEIDNLMGKLHGMNLDAAFNQAQTFYTSTFLSQLDVPFATKLAQSLYTYFTQHGRVYKPWADFVSFNSVTS